MAIKGHIPSGKGSPCPWLKAENVMIGNESAMVAQTPQCSKQAKEQKAATQAGILSMRSQCIWKSY